MTQAEWAPVPGNRQGRLPVTVVGMVCGLLWMAVPRPAAAQSTPSTGQTPAPAPPAEKPAAPVTAGWRDGFFIQSEKGDFRLQIGVLVHADGRFALDDDDETVTDTFLIRRLRPYLRGRLGAALRVLS